MSHDVWIVWGTDPEGMNPCYYSFQTAAELDAFLTGVSEATGWLDQTQFDTESAAMEHIRDVRGEC